MKPSDFIENKNVLKTVRTEQICSQRSESNLLARYNFTNQQFALKFWKSSIDNYNKKLMSENCAVEKQETSQILEMSELSKLQILTNLIKIFNQSEIDRFTVIIKQNPLRPSRNKQAFRLTIDQIANGPTTRPKSSTIDKFYRTSSFIKHQRSRTLNQTNSQPSIDDSQLPQSPKELGQKLYQLGEFSQALEIFKELKEQFPLENISYQYKKQYKEIVNNLGNCYFQLKQYESAMQTYKQLLSQSNSDEWHSEDEKLMGRLYNNLGCCYGKLGYEKQSMNAYNEALKIYNKYTSIDSSSLLCNIANLYYNCQMFSVSETYYEEAIIERQCKRPDDKMLLYHAYLKLSSAQIEQQKCKQALGNLSKALKLTESGYGDPLEILKQSAFVKQLEEKWEEALQFYEKMHLLHEQDKRSNSFIFECVANIYLKLGKMAEYRKYAQLALEEFRKDGNQCKVSELLSNWSIQKYYR